VGSFKIFLQTTKPEKPRFTQKLLEIVQIKFVQIMVPRVGPQWGKPFLHVFILEKNLFSRTSKPISIKLGTNHP
jgi:hypothetical protein